MRNMFIRAKNSPVQSLKIVKLSHNVATHIGGYIERDYQLSIPPLAFDADHFQAEKGTKCNQNKLMSFCISIID